MKLTERKTAQITFSEQEFLNMLRLGGVSREHVCWYDVTAVDVTNHSHSPKTVREVTVRFVDRTEMRPLRQPDDAEVSVLTPSLLDKLRKLRDGDGRPLFSPGYVLGGPDYFDKEPLRLIQASLEESDDAS